MSTKSKPKRPHEDVFLMTPEQHRRRPQEMRGREGLARASEHLALAIERRRQQQTK
jgi:hypothetical protein